MNERRTCISPAVIRFLGDNSNCPYPYYMNSNLQTDCHLCPKQIHFERKEVIERLSRKNTGNSAFFLGE